jgi:Ca2+-binding RTX toxin-like protein
MDALDIGGWLTGSPGYASPTSLFVYGSGGSYRQFGGTGFIFGPSGIFTGGTVTSIYVSDGSGGEPWGIVGMSMTVAALKGYVSTGNAAGFLAAAFAGNDTLQGHSYFAFDDYLNGYGGHDKIYGGAGNDTLVGGAGNDSLSGGIGNDFYWIDNTADIVSEFVGEGVDWVFSPIAVNLTTLSGGHVENAYLTGAANIGATGNAGANILAGNSGANSLSGGAGNDTLHGGAGNDTLAGGNGADDDMFGGDGNDTYYADSADTIDESGDTGIDTVIASTNFSLNWTLGDVEHLTLLAGTDDLIGWGNGLANKITGNNGENSLYGYDGKDTLTGGGGADYLNGGLGNDTLTGGAGNDTVEGGHGQNTINVLEGNDTVRHQPSVDAYDVIQSFDGNATGGQDILDLDAMFDSLGVAGASRGARVQLTDLGASVNVRIDTNGDGTFDYLAATIYSADVITLGTDVLVGS